jgi:hypothetical protein
VWCTYRIGWLTNKLAIFAEGCNALVVLNSDNLALLHVSLSVRE